MILAHRGLTHAANDNSRGSIGAVARSAAAGTPIGIEVDIREALDALVMNHHPIEANVVLALTELQTLVSQLGGTEFLTFEQSLEFMTDIPVVNLEIKHGAIVSSILAALRSHCMATGQSTDCFFFSSFTPQVIADLHGHNQEFRTGLLIDRSLPLEAKLNEVDLLSALVEIPSGRPSALTQWVLDAFDHSGADTLHPHWTHLNADLIAGVRARGKKLVLWDVFDPVFMRALVDHPDVLHVITDYPALMLPDFDVLS